VQNVNSILAQNEIMIGARWNYGGARRKNKKKSWQVKPIDLNPSCWKKKQEASHLPLSLLRLEPKPWTIIINTSLTPAGQGRRRRRRPPPKKKGHHGRPRIPFFLLLQRARDPFFSSSPPIFASTHHHAAGLPATPIDAGDVDLLRETQQLRSRARIET